MNEYFEEKEKEKTDSKDRIYEGYQAVLDSKSTDETLVSLFFYIILQYFKIFLFVKDICKCMKLKWNYSGIICKLGAKTHSTLS